MAAESLDEQLIVPVVVGTRPEAIKLVPIILALRDSPSYQPVVVSTGQHHEMVDEIFALANIEADVQLWAGDNRARLNERVPTVMRRFEDFCTSRFGDSGGVVPSGEDLRAGRFPTAVLVHGDTSSAMAAALAAFHLRIPVIHVEAGLRSGSVLSPFPEELNREVISCIATFHLAPTPHNLQNLLREDIDVGQIFVTGNTGIDALHWAATQDVPFEDPAVAAAFESDQRIVVVTAHRRENWQGGLERIAAGVGAAARLQPDVLFVVPQHPNPRVREELGKPLAEIPNVILTEPIPYASFSRLLARCDLVLTDSGGIQEEAPSLDKPVLVARETTERTEGIDAGTLLLVGTDSILIETEIVRLLTDREAYEAIARRPNPYGDGRAAARIVAALEHLHLGVDAPEPFGSGYSRSAIFRAAGYRAAVHTRHPAGVEIPQGEGEYKPAEYSFWSS
jgi:UDP-N-acetylglucosamine 2-epimerase (non-hydrolysing)